MQRIAFDTETFPIVKHGKATRLKVPRFVCLSWYDGTDSGLIRDLRETLDLFESWITHDKTILIAHNTMYDIGVMLRLASEEGRDLYGPIFEAYQDGRIRDTMIREMLIDIAGGGKSDRGYALDRLERKYLDRNRSAQKHGPDVWRVRYNELAPWPIEVWPEDAKDYAIADAVGAWEVFKAQTEQAGYDAFDERLVEGDREIRNATFQALSDVGFQLGAAWGLLTDPEKTEELDSYYGEIESRLTERLIDAGLMRESGTKDQRAIKEVVLAGWQALGQDPVLTDTGPDKIAAAKVRADTLEAKDKTTWAHVLDKSDTSKGERQTLRSLRDQGYSPLEAVRQEGVISATSTSKKDALQPLEKAGYDDPRFAVLSEFNQAQKFRTTYLEPIVDAYPYAVCPGYNVLVDSGRTSSYAPNVQNIPARGKGVEIRECFIPRPGNAFVQCDYSTLELRTLAQVCLNLGLDSKMADALLEGRDLHLDGAAQILGIDYDLAESVYGNESKGIPPQPDHELYKPIKHERRVFKIANFGYAGALGAETFTDYAAGFGTEITVVQAQKLRDTWFEKWPEMDRYFKYISAQKRYDGRYPIRQHGPHGAVKGWRTRLCPRFTSACNTLFQGLASDLGKLALWEVTKACYSQPDSPLYGFRAPLFIHDEIVLEGPADQAEDAAAELSYLMESAGDVFCPDIPIIAEPNVLTECWTKD